MDEQQKMNPRKQASQTLLKNSFWDLLKKIGFNKITVKELCDQSGLNRKTFYRNYEDIFALVNDAFYELMTKIAEPNLHFFLNEDQTDFTTYKTYDLARIRNIRAEQERLQLIFSNRLEHYAQDAWRRIYLEYFPNHIDAKQKDLFMQDQYFTDYYTSHVAFCCWANLEWIVRNPKLSVEDIQKYTFDVSTTYLHTYYISRHYYEHEKNKLEPYMTTLQK